MAQLSSYTVFNMKINTGPGLAVLLENKFSFYAMMSLELQKLSKYD